MPKDLTKEEVATGAVVYEWWVNEYEQFERSRRWYIVFGIICALLLVYSIVTADYLFALIVVLLGILLYMQHSQEPLQVYFAITETGIILGKKFYRYSELVNFWLIYNPPEVKNLYFTLNSVLKHHLVIPLLDYDPRPIREYLNQYMTEDLDQEDEPVSDKLSRVLRLH